MTEDQDNEQPAREQLTHEQHEPLDHVQLDHAHLARARAALRGEDDRNVAAAAQRVEQRLAAWARTEAADRARETQTPAWTPSAHGQGQLPAMRGWRRWTVRGLGLTAAAALTVVAWHWTMTPSSHAAPRLASTRTYATKIGQQAIVTLDDGTSVTLAPESKLRIGHFGAHNRTVELDGEAYFDVTHVDGAPFVVRTGAVETRVLGTSFFVRRYASDATAHITVMTGKVAVGTHGQQSPLVVTAGRGADATDSTVVAMRDPAQAWEIGWLDGRLVFHDAPTPDVLQALHRWYGYEFRFADSTLAQRSLTVVISTRSSAEALGALKTYLNVDLRFDGQIVTLVPKQASRAVPSPSRVLPPTLTSPKEVGR